MKLSLGLSLLVFCSSLFAETKKHDFEGAATAEVYKEASGDDLWIYRFDPEGHDPVTDQRPAMVFFLVVRGMVGR